MGFFSKFEGKMEDTVEGVASSFGGSTLSPVQITKKAEREMRREKMVGAGVQYAPTLYTVLVSPEDDSRLFGYYPTLAGEVETYLMAKANELGFMMDGQPLVRFISDDQLKRGKFDVVAEMVSSPIIAQLRDEEMQRYGIEAPRSSGGPRNQVKPVVRGAVAGTPAGMARTYDQAQPVRLQPLSASDQMVRPARMPRGQGYYAKNDPLRTSGSLGKGLRGPSAAGGPGGIGSAAAGRSAGAGAGVAGRPAGAGVGAVGAGVGAGVGAAGAGAGVAGRPAGVGAVGMSGAGAAGAGAGAGAGAAAISNAGAFGGGTSAAGSRSSAPNASENQTIMFGQQEAAASPEPNFPISEVGVYLYDEEHDKAFALTGKPQRIGRESGNDIKLPDINASRVHAEIGVDSAGRWVVTDLGSTNGVYVNTRRVESIPLHDGDIILIGTTELEFQQLQ